MTPETYMRRYHNGSEDVEAAAIPAEELFPSCSLGDAETSGCGCGWDCGQNVPETMPTCCCKASMVKALRLLCNSELASLVDFNAFFFLTNSLAVGSPLTVPTTDDPDNIEELTASFRRFSPCNCDLVDVDGTAYFAIPGGDASTALEGVEQLSLCSLKALAFELITIEDPDESEGASYRRALRLLRRAIRTENGTTSSCSICGAHCDCDNCCCDTGILAELASRNLSRQATITAGPLVLQNVTVVGAVGSVLILANEDEERVYFVCVSQIEALG